jgi:voltage-gated potassium channel
LSNILSTTFSPVDDGPPTMLEKAIGAVIALSVLQVVLETEPEFVAKFAQQSRWVEIFFLIFFSVEYLLRLVFCSQDPRYQGLAGRLKYVLSPYALIDLVAILPSLLSLFGADLLLLRAIRLFRLLRITRLVKDNRYLNAFIRSFVKARAPLVASLCVTLFVLFVGAVLIYFAESSAQPEAFGSIPRALWWAMATLTTVGYGDVYPVTVIGKILASFIAILGIGIVAMPAGVIAANFSRELE